MNHNLNVVYVYLVRENKVINVGCYTVTDTGHCVLRPQQSPQEWWECGWYKGKKNENFMGLYIRKVPRGRPRVRWQDNIQMDLKKDLLLTSEFDEAGTG